MEVQQLQGNRTGTTVIGSENAKQITFSAEWHAGPRSAEWDELWRRILFEIFVIAGKPDHAENQKEVTKEVTIE